MRKFFSFLVLCWLCSCNSLYVAQTKTLQNTPSLGVEWNLGEISNEMLQHKVDSVLAVVLEKFNGQKHSFTVHRKKLRDREKDYITIDFQRGKVVGTGGKIAGYTLTTLGLIVTPVTLIALESPVIFGFYYWPQHNMLSSVTLSPNLSGDKRNHKNVFVSTGALFARTDKQVEKLVKKYEEKLTQVLGDIESQLSLHK